jgi:hypothetical protein
MTVGLPTPGVSPCSVASRAARPTGGACGAPGPDLRAAKAAAMGARHQPGHSEGVSFRVGRGSIPPVA